MKRPIRRNRNVFRFMDLPRELRNRIYADAIDRMEPFNSSISHRFNSRLPMLNRQINREASSVMHAIPDLAFWIDSFESLTNLPSRLQKAETMPSFKTCRLDFFPIKWSVLEGQGNDNLPDVRCLPHGRFRKALSLVAEQLSAMTNVEVLEIGYFSTLPITGKDYKFWPDDIMDSFRVLRGFKDVTIKGDLEKSYAEQLGALMRQPREATRDKYRVGQKELESQSRLESNLLSSMTLSTNLVNGSRLLVRQ